MWDGSVIGGLVEDGGQWMQDGRLHGAGDYSGRPWPIIERLECHREHYGGG